MSINIEVIKNTDIMADEWDEFLLENYDGNILQSSLISRVFHDTGFDSNLILAKRGSDIVGGALSTIWPGKRKYGFLSAFSTWKTTYGPLAIGSEKKDIMKKIIYCLNDCAREYGAMKNILVMKDKFILSDLNEVLRYDIKPDIVGCTFIIDLQKPENQLWSNIGRKQHRHSIKKALKNNVYVKESRTNDTPKIMYNLHLETTKRLGISPNPYEFFLSIWNNLVNKNYAKIFLAYYQDKPVAGSIVLLYKKDVYDYINASNYEALKFGANKLLLWELITWGHEKGYKNFDLLFNPISGGLYDFKKYFGGLEIPVYYYEKLFSPFKWGLWSKIMIPIYNKINRL